MNSTYTMTEKTTPGELSTKKMLWLIGLAALASLLLAVVPLLGIFNYPFRLLITIVHELGHGLAAILTGGEFIRFVVFSDGSGQALTAGGWRFVVIPAGYLGAALFGAGLIVLGRRPRQGRIALGVIGAAMLLLSLRYGLPSIVSEDFLAGILTTVSGVIFGALFVAIAVKAAAEWIVFLLHLIAIQAGLNAFSDLMTVIGLSTQFFNMPNNDAKSMAELTFIPAIIWALLWAITALVLVGGAIWTTWVGPALARERKFFTEKSAQIHTIRRIRVSVFWL